MGYVESSLAPGENLITKAQLHWGIFVSPALNSFLFLLLLVWSYIGETNITCACIAWIFFVASILVLIRTGMTLISTEFGLTDRRIIAKRGIIKRDSLELMLNRVESIAVDQPLVGRLLGYGSIVVTGTGGTKHKYLAIANPMELRNQVNNQLM